MKKLFIVLFVALLVIGMFPTRVTADDIYDIKFFKPLAHHYYQSVYLLFQDV